MTYIIPDAMALNREYQQELRRSGRAPAFIQTKNYQKRTAPAELVRALTQSPMGRTWRDPRLGTGNAGQSTQYLGGLGSLGADQVQDILSTMSEDVKRKLVESAAINTGITLALTALGPATLGITAVIAGVYALVGSLIGAKYRRQSAELVADFENEVKVKAAALDAKIADRDREIMKEQEPAARALALSNVALGAFDGFSDWFQDRVAVVTGYASDVVHDPFKTIKTAVMRPIKTAQTVVSQVVPVQILDVYKSVAQPIEDTGNRMYNAAEDARDTVTGRAALTTTENAINDARVALNKSLEEQAARITADHESPAFRNQLTVMMAKQIRADPSVQSLINTQPAIVAPGTVTSLPSKKLAFLPMAGAAAAVIAFGFMKG